MRGAAMFTKIRRVVIAGFCLVGMLTISALTAKAQNTPESFEQRSADIVQTPRFSPFIVTPPLVKPGKHVDIIRIGRLELIRKSQHEEQADGQVPHPFDPLEMLRAQLGMGPNPAIAISFDLKWRER
jgi:hypothetical protein